jgi:hypothetical protein
LLAVVAAAGCGDDQGTDPAGLRFGQVGEVQLRVETPLFLGQGTLTQTVTWGSQGPFQLEEVISYEGVEGDRSSEARRTNAEVLAGEYAIWIVQINEAAGLELFVDALDPDLDPECGLGRSQVTLRIRDDLREETVSWTRCVNGTLTTLSTNGAGPEPAAARVANAAILLRNATVGSGFRSSYEGSVPFATVDRGEDSRATLTASRSISDEGQWESFWQEHSGGTAPTPEIDFQKDVVIVGAVGVRQEAGDSVEIRRVLPVDQKTIVVLVERIPGNFCSPAARVHVPFHIVRAPRVPLPVEFADPAVETVPCGI